MIVVRSSEGHFLKYSSITKDKLRVLICFRWQCYFLQAIAYYMDRKKIYFAYAIFERFLCQQNEVKKKDSMGNAYFFIPNILLFVPLNPRGLEAQLRMDMIMSVCHPLPISAPPAAAWLFLPIPLSAPYKSDSLLGFFLLPQNAIMCPIFFARLIHTSCNTCSKKNSHFAFVCGLKSILQF